MAENYKPPWALPQTTFCGFTAHPTVLIDFLFMKIINTLLDFAL